VCIIISCCIQIFFGCESTCKFRVPIRHGVLVCDQYLRQSNSQLREESIHGNPLAFEYSQGLIHCSENITDLMVTALLHIMGYFRSHRFVTG
jgi:hypothetical protein